GWWAGGRPPESGRADAGKGPRGRPGRAGARRGDGAAGARVGRYGQARATIDRAHGYRARRSVDASTRAGVYQRMPSIRPSLMAASPRWRASGNGRVDVTPAAAYPSRSASLRSAYLRAAQTLASRLRRGRTLL